MKKIMVTAGLVLLAGSGCATSRQTFGPDGRQAFSLNCSGLALSWGACYEKAGSICGARGYDVVSANGESGAVVTANPQSAFGSSVISRSMVVSCKGAVPSQKETAGRPASTDGDCRTRVISSGGKPIPKDEQC